METEQLAHDLIARYVRYGYRFAEIERIVDQDVFEGEAPRKRLRGWIKAAVALQRAEQESWPAVTDCDRLDQAFDALRAGRILAIHDAGYTPSECIAEMSEQYRAGGGESSGVVGYCCYHRQDMDYALLCDKLGVAYVDIKGDDRQGAEVGRQVCAALAASGLRVAWSGSIKDKINVTDFRWQRRV